MVRKVIIVLMFLLLPASVYAESMGWDLDFDAEASSNEHPAEACIYREAWGSQRTKATDCEINVNLAKSIFICWDTNDDILGTHGATDWSLLVRATSMEGTSFPTAGATTGGSGTDPTSTDYFEADNLGNNDIGCFALTPGPYAIKIRVKTPSATIAAPSIRIKVGY